MAFEAGQLVGNRYRISRVMSQGAFGSTYLAEDVQHTGMYVTIETRPLSPELQPQQVQREISLLRELTQPNILHLLDSGTEADTPYLVFEYDPNGSLRDRHPYGSKVPLPTVVEYVKQVANALQYVHDHGIIHRDVKPENMLIGRKGEVLLSDFGIAVNYPGATASTLAGTARYMAPEQFSGKAEPASDQYSLGVVIYEWLCGRPPFIEGSINRLLYQHYYESPPPLTAINPTIPRDVEQVGLIALEKDPRRRFGSMRAFARAFEQASIPPTINPPSVFLQPPSTMPLLPQIEDEGDEDEIDRIFAPSPPTVQGSYNRYLDDSNTSLDFDLAASTQHLSEEPLPHHDVEEQPETQLSLYALASARLEADDRAIIGKQYTLEAGLTQQRPENFVGEPFRVAVRNPAEPLLFHVMLHPSPNIQLLGAWYQPLHYAPLSTEPQFITCPFRLNAAGESYLLINFYRERQWLKSIRLEFEGIEQTSFSNATNWR